MEKWKMGFLAHLKWVVGALLATSIAWSGFADADVARRFGGKEIKEWINDKLRENGPILFLSRNGIAYRMDSDSEIWITDDHRVKMLEFGYGLATYAGTYQISENGTVVFRFKSHEFPEVYLYQKGKNVYMTSLEPSGFLLGRRGAALETTEMEPFWPFKYVEKPDENP